MYLTLTGKKTVLHIKNNGGIENMRYEDVQDYILLQDMFQVRCEDVCRLLRPLNDSYGYLSDFEISDNEVWGEGDEYLGYGESDHHSAKFPSNFLWKDDEEIKQYVEDELKKREQAKENERLRIQKLQEEAQEKRDREEYERLKKKFG
jgi:hypothetical protein